MSVTLTPAAAERVKQYLSQTPGGIGLSVDDCVADRCAAPACLLPLSLTPP